MAVVMQEPGQLALREVGLVPAGEGDVIVDVEWSGVSTGTERLLWSGRMPGFPGMGYPLVPGYESVGKVIEARPGAGLRVGERVFVPGSSGFEGVRGLFGGAAARVVLPGRRALPVPDALGERAVLLALAATAYHAVGAARPELIVGHGVLGRLMARLALLQDGPPPAVWERDPERAGGAAGYAVLDPERDGRRDYQVIVDASGDASLLDSLIGRLARGGEVVLAGFYGARVDFAFPPAFMREARLRLAAEWQEPDLLAVRALVESGRLSLDGLITHRHRAVEADAAYRTAFGDPACLKMILDWRASA
jgi:bacteriochlorophyllide a dehydrogenase